MKDKFTFFSGSGDALPGRGSNEQKNTTETYTDLRKIKNQRLEKNVV